MSNLTVDLENLTEEERKQLLSLVKKSQNRERWKPAYGERYYAITNGTGKVDPLTWKNDDYDFDALSIGNVFHTEEEAKFEVERLKVITELKAFAEKNNDEIDWANTLTWKYYIGYLYEFDKVVANGIKQILHNDTYFSSMEIAKRAIETVGENRLKKYYFRMGE